MVGTPQTFTYRTPLGFLFIIGPFPAIYYVIHSLLPTFLATEHESLPLSMQLLLGVPLVIIISGFFLLQVLNEKIIYSGNDLTFVSMLNNSRVVHPGEIKVEDVESLGPSGSSYIVVKFKSGGRFIIKFGITEYDQLLTVLKRFTTSAEDFQETDLNN